ncbi:MAG: PAS domain S-box protein [Methanogenium sp.]|nr:PAS domain S-box protein [Methanogenium sp.]
MENSEESEIIAQEEFEFFNELVGEYCGKDLPDSQGLDTLSGILSEKADVAIIVLTVESNEEIGISAVKMGALDYLFKGQVEPFHIVHSIRYALEQNSMKGALRKSEERYRSLIQDVMDTSGVGIFILDADFRIVWINKAMERFFGLRREEVIGKDKRQVIKESILHIFSDPETFAEKVLATYENNTYVEKFECHVLGGETRNDRWLQHRSQPIRTGLYSGGRSEHYTDITSLKQAEKALTTANKKLNILTSVTRHDILNQLTVVLGYLDVHELMNSDPDAQSSECITKAARASARIARLLFFTREYQQIGVEGQIWIKLVENIDKAVRDTTPDGVLVENNVPADVLLFTDPLFEKVFYNLIDNAVRHGGKVTTVRFSLEERGEDLIVLCEDDGVGIPLAEKEKIFERGFGKNTGVGLFLTREILSITGITITETGEPGKGARFEIVVPKEVYRTA